MAKTIKVKGFGEVKAEVADEYSDDSKSAFYFCYKADAVEAEDSSGKKYHAHIARDDKWYAVSK